MIDSRTAIFAIVLAIAPLAQGEKKYTIGFESDDNMLSNIDSVAIAFKYLFNEFAASQGLNFEFKQFRSEEEARQAYSSGLVDVFAINSPGFFRLEEDIRKKIYPALILSGSDRPTTRYCLVVRKGVVLDDLKGKSINIRSQQTNGIEVLWAEVLVLEQYNAFSKEYFKSVNLVEDVSDAVLPVFFGKADACVVPEPQYELLVELNQHISKKLEVISLSPPLVSLITFFTDRDNSLETQNAIVNTAMGFHKTPKGEQALTLVQLTRLFKYNRESIAQTKGLVDKHQKLSEGVREPLALTEDE